jgi:hypothetical protein
LILQGGIEMVKSKETGNFYATAKRATVTSTFDEQTCKSLVGEKLPGVISKENCEAYNYTIRETGEIVELSHRWVYLPEEPAAKPVYQGKVTEPLVEELI